jgi:hypothetical protein
LAKVSAMRKIGKRATKMESAATTTGCDPWRIRY